MTSIEKMSESKLEDTFYAIFVHYNLYSLNSERPPARVYNPLSVSYKQQDITGISLCRACVQYYLRIAHYGYSCFAHIRHQQFVSGIALI